MSQGELGLWLHAVGSIREGLTENLRHSTPLSKKTVPSQLTIFPSNSHMPLQEESGSLMRRVIRFLVHSERGS